MINARVLLVDDEPEIRRLLSRHLRRLGYTVREAGDGEEAAALVKEQMPSVVITDMAMPRLGGLEVAVSRAIEVRELRAKAREAFQVEAIRELAVTASDRILNPLNVISLSVERLTHEGITTEAKAKAVANIETAIETITRIVRQMRTVARYTPREVAPGLREIDLDQATGDE